MSNLNVASFERNAYTQTQKLHDNLHSHKTERDNINKEFFYKKDNILKYTVILYTKFKVFRKVSLKIRMPNINLNP